MDRNTFTGLFLILIILVGSTFLMQPSDEDIKREKAKQSQDSIAKVKKAETPLMVQDSTKTVVVPALDSTLIKAGPFGSAQSGSIEPIVLENELLRVKISPKGGRIASVELKKFKTYRQLPLIMFEGQGNKFGLIFGAAGKNISTNDLYFQPLGTSFSVAKIGSGSLTMRLNYSEGKYIDYIYSLTGDSYNVGLTIATKGMQDVVTPTQKHLTLNWETILKQKEKDLVSEQRYSSTYFKQGDENVDYLSLTESETKSITEGKIKWFSFKQHFFSNVLIAKNSFDKGELIVNTSPDSNTVKSFAANMQIPFERQEVTSYPMNFYFGPNQLNILEKQGFEIEKQITKSVYKISNFKSQEEIENNKKRIICPYHLGKGNARPISEQEFKSKYPKCYAYLISEKENLASRDKGKSIFEPFFVWGRTQGLNKLGKKILNPTFSQFPRFLLVEEEDAFFTNGYGLFFHEEKTNLSLFDETTNPITLIENIDVVQKILNSCIMHYYVSKTSVSIEGGYPCYQKNFIEKFTIPQFSNEEINVLRTLNDKQEIDEFLIIKYQLNLPVPNLST